MAVRVPAGRRPGRHEAALHGDVAGGPGRRPDVPAGQTIQLYLRSPDVIHAFYVPQFLFKRDVVPGITNQFDLDRSRRATPARRTAASARSCAASATGSCCSRSTPSPRPTSRPGMQKQIAAAQRDAAAARRPARPPGRRSTLVAKNVKFDQATLDRTGEPASPIDFDNQDAGRPHDVAILDCERHEGLRRPDPHRPRGRGPTRSRRSPPGPTSSSARSIQHRCSARSRSSKGAPMATTTLTPAASAYRSGLYEWLTTTDHKKIGILYIVNSFLFFFIGGLLALGVRTELAQPGIQFVPERAGLQPALHDARHDHDLPVHHPDAGRLRELRRAAPDRRAGHGLPADQRPVASGCCRSAGSCSCSAS